MRWLTIKKAVLPFLAILALSQRAQGADTIVTVHDTVWVQAPTWDENARDSRYQHHVAHAKKTWTKLVPNQLTLQYAGSIGAWNVGLGWHYGRKLRWESELLLGFVPHGNAPDNHCTLTLRETYSPWHIKLSTHRRWEFNPISVGIGVNYIFGEDFWRDDSGRVTSCYKLFNTRIRFHLALGEELKLNVPKRHRHFVRSIRAYYQLVATDVYIVSAVGNRHQRSIADWFKIGLGLKLDVF